MFNYLLKTTFRLLGWKIVGDIPLHTRKALIAVCPHNTWKDFPIGICARAALSKKIAYLGKAELFKPPFGFIFYALGGKPLIRTVHQNQVQAVAATFKQYDDLVIAMAPEGTRKNVEKLRSGFYYIAYEGGADIIPCGFDFKRKEVILSNPFKPSGDFKVDIQTYFLPFFRTISGVDKDWFKNYEAGKF